MDDLRVESYLWDPLSPLASITGFSCGCRVKVSFNYFCKYVRGWTSLKVKIREQVLGELPLLLQGARYAVVAVLTSPRKLCPLDVHGLTECTVQYIAAEYNGLAIGVAVSSFSLSSLAFLRIFSIFTIFSIFSPSFLFFLLSFIL